jgi:hypothetical protein
MPDNLVEIQIKVDASQDTAAINDFSQTVALHV